MTLNALDADWLNHARAPHLPKVVCKPSVTSTNDVLRADLMAQRAPYILLANEQTQGRGRRNRGWISPPNAGLYLSMPHFTRRPTQTLPSISVLLALSVAQAIGQSVAIKWPNDLVMGHETQWSKVGGCLVDVCLGRQAPHPVILGVGLNLRLAESIMQDQSNPPDQPWADLATIDDRNALALAIIHQIDANFTEFEAQGFAPFVDRWQGFNALDGQSVRVLNDDAVMLEGIAGTVNDQGQLAVHVGEAVSWLSVGEISIRQS